MKKEINLIKDSDRCDMYLSNMDKISHKLIRECNNYLEQLRLFEHSYKNTPNGCTYFSREKWLNILNKNLNLIDDIRDELCEYSMLIDTTYADSDFGGFSIGEMNSYKFIDNILKIFNVNATDKQRKIIEDKLTDIVENRNTNYDYFSFK